MKPIKKNVLLIGGRSKARALAVSLVRRGYQVTAINRTPEDCRMLSQRGLTVVNGDGAMPATLKAANAGECAIVIALAPRDEDNLVACELCKKLYGVKKTVALLSDPRKTELFYRLGVDSVVCAISTVTSIIEQQAFMDAMTSIVPIGEGRVQIAEVPITANSPVVGKRVWEIILPHEVIIGCILRGDLTMIPRGDTRILAGDQLVVISGNGQQSAALKALTGR